MSGNSIAISRELLAAGVEEKTANAVAEAIVKNSDERYATKVEILELKDSLKDEINALRNQVNAFEADTRAEFKAVRAEFKAVRAEIKAAQVAAKEEARRNDMRFNFIMGLLVVLVAATFVPLLQNLGG